MQGLLYVRLYQIRSDIICNYLFTKLAKNLIFQLILLEDGKKKVLYKQKDQIKIIGFLMKMK